MGGVEPPPLKGRLRVAYSMPLLHSACEQRTVCFPICHPLQGAGGIYEVFAVANIVLDDVVLSQAEGCYPSLRDVALTGH